PEGHAHAIAPRPVHLAERRRGIAHVNEVIHAYQFGEVMRVLDAGDSQRRRTDHGVSAIQPDALITITAYGSRTPGAVTEVLRQTIRIRPYLADLAAHGKHIAASHGPPLLDAQAA